MSIPDDSSISTGVPKNPFATESKLDDLIWFCQKMTGPSLLLFSCIIGICIVLGKVPETRVNKAEGIFQLSLGSGLLAMGVNVTGLLAFGKKANYRTSSPKEGPTIEETEQLSQSNSLHRSDNNSLPLHPKFQSEERFVSNAFADQEATQKILPERQTTPSAGFPIASNWRA